MDLTPYIATLREDLTTAAAAGDDQTRRTAAVLSAALEPAVRLAIMNALSDLAAEVTASLDDHVVSLRLDGRDVNVVVTSTAPADEPTAEDTAASAAFIGDPTGDISRITVRLMEELKAKAEQAASAQGQSLNAFVAQAVQGALNNQHRGGRGRGRNRGQWWDDNRNWGGHGGGRGWPGWNDQGPGQGRGGQGGSRVSGWVEG
ncbi:toxin-antitoxin system HicB family antitoxin [Kutzneria buriramensis]|uniref:HicB-like protein involved in pilus formation n=1 Tax=Kutzneria buriramensis TaxID=1045776 RepID=A0A3E0I0V0_9PSEU|nr:toxin-antitoxin system HicB family antitoxin [Kutzneria buriramensis]REH52170.1 HicB-like protein involved in pilus formation [Kutzneria buriramensis]